MPGAPQLRQLQMFLDIVSVQWAESPLVRAFCGPGCMRGGFREQRLRGPSSGCSWVPPPTPARNSLGSGIARQLHCQEIAQCSAARFLGCEAEGLVLSRDWATRDLRLCAENCNTHPPRKWGPHSLLTGLLILPCPLQTRGAGQRSEQLLLASLL